MLKRMDMIDTRGQKVPELIYGGCLLSHEVKGQNQSRVAPSSRRKRGDVTITGFVILVLQAYSVVNSWSSSWRRTYRGLRLQRRAVADDVIDGQTDGESNALEDDLAVLALILEDVSGLGLDQIITEAAEIHNLGTRNALWFTG